MERIATMEHSINNIGKEELYMKEESCVKDCFSCARGRLKLGSDKIFEPCKRGLGIPSRGEHLNCPGCEYHVSHEEMQERKANPHIAVQKNFQQFASAYSM